MFEYFYKGLIFAPVYACVVYAVIFLINWKRLHISQRIFTFSLFAILCSLLLFQCIIMEDLDTCKSLIFLNSFAGPALVVIFFLFTYSQMQTKSIFRPKLLALYTIPFLSLSLLAVNFLFGTAGNKELEAIVYSVVHSTSDLETTPLIEFQYLLYRFILIFGSIAVAIYYIYKIKWFEKLAQRYVADTDAAVVPMSRQLSLTFLLFVAVTAAQFFKKVVPEEHSVIGAEIYGVFMVGLIIHTCRAVHHGYTRMTIEGDDMDKMDAEMQFLYDSFDEKTWSLIDSSANADDTGGNTSAFVAENVKSANGTTLEDGRTIKNGAETTGGSAANSASFVGNGNIDGNGNSSGNAAIGGNGNISETATCAETPSGNQQKAPATASPTPSKVVAKTDDGGDDEAKRHVLEYVQSSDIEHELKKVMIVKKLYMQQNITIKDVANAIGTNHYYLSVYLNHVLHTSFSDYISRLRIEREVLPRMQKNPQISTKELIVVSNFSHRTTFYRAFQKVMGVTFQDYKASMKTP